MDQTCLTLTKIDETTAATVSTLTLDGHFICFVLEDGYREKKVPGLTRIPGGVYPIIPRDYGGFYERYKVRYGWPYIAEIANVPNYKHILIHAGNRPIDTRGCLLPASGVILEDKVKGLWTGLSSVKALKNLMRILGPKLEQVKRREIELFIDIGR